MRCVARPWLGGLTLAWGAIALGCGDSGARCGNGILEPGEMCDSAIAQGRNGACPDLATCDDHDPCTADTIAGNGCQATCQHAHIPGCTVCDSGTPPDPTVADGCCPPGADRMTDIDCASVCGNGLLEPGETCDSGIASGSGKCPTETSCNDSQACTTDLLTGVGCQAACMHQEITTAGPLDGCCPSGANHNTDPDCSATCGNGAVELGESCDIAIPAGMPGACPTATDCDDANACTVDALLSAGTCDATCAHTSITVIGAADGCCPPGGNANTDVDCAAVCGNGALEAGEQCDTSIPPGTPGACPRPGTADCDDAQVCTIDTTSGGGCTARCVHTLRTPDAATRDGCCPPGANANTDVDCLAVCGNGAVEPAAGELCDSGIAAGAPGACPTLADCNDGVACTVDSLAGAGCTLHCVHTPQQGPADCSLGAADQCCPTGCTSATDLDCPPGCGNGVVDPGESCDTAIAAGAGRCPRDAATDCNDRDACTADGISAAGTCTAACVHTAITQIGPADGCCPAGGTVDDDPDCPARCGDGVLTPPESCDPGIAVGAGSCPLDCPPIACATAMLSGSPQTCNVQCNYTPVACSGATRDQCCSSGCTGQNDIDCAVCGNGVRELGELCDGAFSVANADSCPGGTADCDTLLASMTTLPDGPACYDSSLAGSPAGCNAVCSFVERQPSGPTADGCCPTQTGANAGNDVDCPP